MKGDTPTDRVNVIEMDDKQLEAFITGIRERRLRAVKIFEEGELLREEARKKKLDKSLEHELKMLQKEIAQIDKVIEKLEKRIIKVRAIKLQLED
tara:strand:- start:4 stop:288 length:285 start_codon:yes stop_codon:yes gene_type:complete